MFAVPVQMKKSRPGTLLTVLCQPDDSDKLSQIIFAETTTLGVRRREEQRQFWRDAGLRSTRNGVGCG